MTPDSPAALPSPRARSATRRYRIVAAVLLVPVLLLASEIALYMIGRSLQNEAPALEPELARSGDYPVWCVGDSHTQGTGVDPAQSYPQRLQHHLAIGGLSARVLNLGIGGTNSRQQMKRVAAALENGRPELLVFMGGLNDNWNLAELDLEFLRRSYGWRGVAISVLQRSRTFKFLFNYLLPHLLRASPRRGDLAASLIDEDDIADILLFSQSPAIENSLSERLYLTPREHLLYGAVLIDKARYADALPHITSAAPYYQAIPTPVSADLILAETRRLAEGQSPSRATVRFYDSYIPTGPQDRLCHRLGRGWVLAANGDLEGAWTDFLEARRMTEHEGTLIWQYLPEEALGWVALMKGDRKSAEQRFNAVLDPSRRKVFHHRNDLLADYGLAWIKIADKDPAAAEKILAAAEARPSRTPFEAAWANILRAYAASARGDIRLSDEWRDQAGAIMTLKTSSTLRDRSPAVRDIPSQSHLQIPMAHWLIVRAGPGRTTSLEHNLDELFVLARRNGFQMVLMGYPFLDANDPNDALSGYASAHGVPYVNLLKEIGDIHKNGLLGADENHPSAAGYDAIARALANRILPLLHRPRR